MRRGISLIVVLCLIAGLFCCGALAQQGPEGISPGESGARVRQMQQRLIELGIMKSKADGIYGPKTEAAVLALQQHLAEKGHEVEATGQADSKTLALLYDDLAVSEYLDLAQGDKGNRVRKLQAALYDLRLLDTLPDGDFGVKTGEAVAAFQQLMLDAGIQDILVTGKADHPTRQLLFGDLKALPLRVPQTFDDSHPKALTPEDLYARSAILVDITHNKELLLKDAHARRYPASTTKIMTLLIALEKLPGDRVVKVPKEAGEVPKDSSLTPVYPGEEMPVSDLFYGLMLRSGNDAANALAVLASGSVEAFVSEMNSRAARLGMKDTHFMNPHGYHDSEHYSSAADMARLAAYAIKRPDFFEIVIRQEHEMRKTMRRDAMVIRVNTDLFQPASPFYYEGAFGVKSGFTRAAGFCYVGCATRDDRTLLAVVMNCRTRDQAWIDMGRLFDFGFASK